MSGALVPWTDRDGRVVWGTPTERRAVITAAMDAIVRGEEEPCGPVEEPRA